MAGTILVTEKDGLATSTVEFDYLAEKIRLAFSPEESAIVSVIYEPLDEGGMTFISATELGKDEFRAFVRAVKRAYEKSMQDGSLKGYSERWTELIEILDKDPRSQMSLG